MYNCRPIQKGVEQRGIGEREKGKSYLYLRDRIGKNVLQVT